VTMARLHRIYWF